jgi:NADPH:quinone reductase-like Zn-dependent oxidoreductase
MAVMRAATRHRYGSAEMIEIAEVPTPVPGDHDVLIRVHAASLNRSDWEGLVGKPFYARLGGLRRPRQPILGTDVAGRVEAVGAAVEAFRPGDEVLGDIMYHGGGAFAEFVCVSETALIVPKPPSLSFAEASTIPQAAVIALQGIEGRVESGHRVLVNGGGGGAGMFAVQLAKAAGAEVTGVDNGHKQDFMRSIGADHVIDYTRDDYTRSGVRHALVVDLVCERSMFAIRRAIAPGGRYSLVGGTTRALLSAATIGRMLSTGGRRIGVLMVKPRRDDLARAADMVASGALRTHIDASYPLERAPEAFRHLGEGRALGKIVVTVD